MRSFFVLSLLFVGLLLATLWAPDSTAIEDADVVGAFGDAIPGLDAIDNLRFKRGRDVFRRRFERQDGLGPHFNATSCASCHELPVAGGSAPRYRDFFLAAKTQLDGTVTKLYPDCTELNADEADTALCLPSMVVPNYGPRGTIDDKVHPDVEHPPVPADADIVARRNTPPVFGVGLFRLVSDEEILRRADPGDVDGDGISGRVNHISKEEGAIGRFGYKCQTASIEAFNRGALQNQMGVTSNSIEFAELGGHPGQISPSGFLDVFETKTAHAQVAEPKDRILDHDSVPDPELSRGELIELVFFQENLAAPPRGRITLSVMRGEEIFTREGCATCHVPSLETSLGLIHPYTDLLLHDMGPELADGLPMEEASGSEFRTQPLWGLCEHGPFLHDGRADTIEQAILQHGGEAMESRQDYVDLSEAEKVDLHRFLESL